MPRKVIIDCDPGIDDALAVTLALFNPNIEIAAITAVEGTVSAAQASRNVQAIVERLDPPLLPRIGAARELEKAPSIDSSQMYGRDGLGNSNIEISRLHHQHSAEKILAEEIKANSNQLTILCFGPLTNLARAFRYDPDLVTQVGRIVMLGGSIMGVGDVAPAAEFNMFYDPQSAREVFQSPTTKTLVPLEVTRKVPFTFDFANKLPSVTSRAGRLLREIVPFLFRAWRQELGQESICLSGAIALLVATNPELFEFEEMAGDVEVSGELTTGATVFDRRPKLSWRPNMEVAVDIDAVAAVDCIARAMLRAEELS